MLDIIKFRSHIITALIALGLLLTAVQTAEAQLSGSVQLKAYTNYTYTDTNGATRTISSGPYGGNVTIGGISFYSSVLCLDANNNNSINTVYSGSWTSPATTADYMASYLANQFIGATNIAGDGNLQLAIWQIEYQSSTHSSDSNPVYLNAAAVALINAASNAVAAGYVPANTEIFYPSPNTSQRFIQQSLYAVNGAISSTGSNGLGISWGLGTPTTLTGSNSYTGPTIIGTTNIPYGASSGFTNELILGSSSALPTSSQLIFASPASGQLFTSMLDLSSNNASIEGLSGSTNSFITNSGTAATLTVSTVVGSTNAFNGKILGAMNLVVSGSGTQTLTASNNYSDGTLLKSGTLAISNNAALGTGSVTFASNATLATLTNLKITNNYSVANGATGAFDLNGYTLTNSGVISGAGAISMVDTGTLVLTSSNTYAGGTKINAGTVAISNNAALGSGTVAFASNATLGVQANLKVTNNYTVAGNATATFDNNGYSLTNSGVISGAGALTKIDAGTLTLSGTNTYLGTTTIASNGGTLSLGTTGKLASTNIVVNSGGTLLFGNSNQVTSSPALTLSNGTVSMAGNGSTRAGTNTFSTLTLTANSTIDFSSLTGNSALNFNNILGLDTFKLTILNWNGTTYSGNIVGGGITTQINDLGTLTAQQLANISFYSGTSTNSGFLGTGIFSGHQIIPVPEPGVVIAAFLLLISLMIPAKWRDNRHEKLPAGWVQAGMITGLSC